MMRSEKEIRESLAEMERMANSADNLLNSGKLNGIPVLIEKFTMWKEKSKARANILKWVLGLPYLDESPPSIPNDNVFKFKVDLIESERGWGQKIDETKEFDTYEEAVKFMDDFNKDNNKDSVPDWYMVAMPNNFEINSKSLIKGGGK